MNYIQVVPTTPGRRHLMWGVEKMKGSPHKKLLAGPMKKHAGRNSLGRITTRHRGGGEKRQFRIIDWKRQKKGVLGRVERLEYDPNRSAFLALLLYTDGDRRYILAPEGLVVGQTVQVSEDAPITPGNAMSLSKIPVGTPIHNLELTPGKGGQMVRSAGQAAFIQAKEDAQAVVDVKLPSGELRRLSSRCLATIGQVGNVHHQQESLGKAGRRRHMGWRPEVRGTAMNPKRHPHGGGEGRSGVGLKAPKSLWGKRMGKKTRRKKYSNRWILKDRRIKE